jgi:antibiotic biosynthesis monooxygenase
MTDEPHTTITAGADLITLINVFTCPEVRQNELVEALDRATREIFTRLDGFISANLHASLDQTHVVNYAQWRSIHDLDRAQEHPEVRKHVDEIMSIAESADPRLFRVRAVYHG